MNAEKDRMMGNTFIAENLIGSAPCFKETIRKIKTISKFDVGVYIFGETGTGKELTARAIHYLSARRDGPFIPLSCGGLNDELILNELFGHAKGAFTGATTHQPGMIELADNGTLFLDEIDSMTPKAQIAFLRFLQEKEFRSLGATDIRRIDTRIICASNQDLKQCVKAGTFRHDLLYRLDLLRINLPPLRDRGTDIVAIAKHFIHKFRDIYNLGAITLSDAKIEEMMAYHWPGNVRELENFMLKLCLLAEPPNLLKKKRINSQTEPVAEMDSKTSIDLREGFNDTKARAVRKFERHYLQALLKEANGNISQAARIAKKERRTLTRLLNKHGIRRNDFLQSRI